MQGISKNTRILINNLPCNHNLCGHKLKLLVLLLLVLISYGSYVSVGRSYQNRSKTLLE